MAKQREQERALAMRAVGELKTLRLQIKEKDLVTEKAAQRIKVAGSTLYSMWEARAER